MTRHDFRDKVEKLLPGYTWGVKRSDPDDELIAVGKQHRALNRTSTITVRWKAGIWRVTSAIGHHVMCDAVYTQGPTLALAVRVLRLRYHALSVRYAVAAADIKRGRKKPKRSCGSDEIHLAREKS